MLCYGPIHAKCCCCSSSSSSCLDIGNYNKILNVIPRATDWKGAMGLHETKSSRNTFFQLCCYWLYVEHKKCPMVHKATSLDYDEIRPITNTYDSRDATPTTIKCRGQHTISQKLHRPVVLGNAFKRYRRHLWQDKGASQHRRRSLLLIFVWRPARPPWALYGPRLQLKCVTSKQTTIWQIFFKPTSIKVNEL